MKKLFAIAVFLIAIACLGFGLSADEQVTQSESGITINSARTQSIGKSIDSSPMLNGGGWQSVPGVVPLGRTAITDEDGPAPRESYVSPSALMQPMDGCVFGTMVFSQTVHPYGGSWSASTSDLDVGYYVYDYFPGPDYVTAVKFWGVNAEIGAGGNPCEENPMGLAVGFFVNSGGIPGGTIETFYDTVYGTPTGEVYGMAGPLYEYTIVLDTPLFVEDCLVSVVGTDGPSCNFLWMSGDGYDDECVQWVGSGYDVRPNDVAFCLSTSGCPEYSNFTLPPEMPHESPSFRTSDDGFFPYYCTYDNVDLCYMESIRFWGINAHFGIGWDPCSESPMTFEIKFYYDDGGVPGAMYESFVVDIEGEPTGLKYWGGDYELMEYEAYFGPTKVFDGWVSIQGIGGPFCSFLWVQSRSVKDNSCLQWDGSVMVPQSFDMAFCILGETPCCGLYTDPYGYTGNANCSTDGKLTLSDITRLIDHVYISKLPLCCEEAGNTNGSLDGKVTLSDITRLIDNVYISKALTEPCL